MATFSTKDGFTVEDLLHFGFAHIEAAHTLFAKSPTFFDSAGYLAHLGAEVILKAWHLHSFGEFTNTHGLVELFNKLKEKGFAKDLGPQDDEFLAQLDKFYHLRYPRRQADTVEIGSIHLQKIDALVERLLRIFPETLIAIYDTIDPTKKGGRVLMKKKINADE